MIILVTGASSGIGKATAQVLAKRGHHVAIVCRDPAKADVTMREIDGDVELFMADLSLLGEVHKLAAALHDRYDRLDVLINNAGINSGAAQRTSDGFDPMMTTNYLAPVLLTHLVGDLLVAAPQGRVVNVASEAHRMAAPIDFDTLPSLGDYRGGIGANRAYGLTKLLLILHTQELARRVAGTAVTANSLCPGLVNTNLIGAQAMVRRIGDVLSRTPLINTPRQGAQMSIKLATDPTLARTTGEFFTSTPPARLLPPVGARRDVALQRRLWDETDTWLSR